LAVDHPNVISTMNDNMTTHRNSGIIMIVRYIMSGHVYQRLRRGTVTSFIGDGRLRCGVLGFFLRLRGEAIGCVSFHPGYFLRALLRAFFFFAAFFFLAVDMPGFFFGRGDPYPAVGMTDSFGGPRGRSFTNGRIALWRY
jgi:hypothetical protein